MALSDTTLVLMAQYFLFQCLSSYKIKVYNIIMQHKDPSYDTVLGNTPLLMYLVAQDLCVFRSLGG